jgi:hypothetical protein
MKASRPRRATKDAELEIVRVAFIESVLNGLYERSKGFQLS